MSTAEIKGTLEDAAESKWTQGLARLGLVAKGVTFGIVAGLALMVAFRVGGELTDRQGALQVVAGKPFGRFLIGSLAIGLAGYALWCFVRAILGEKLESEEEVSVWKRVTYSAQGLLYSWLSITCATLVFQADEGGGKGKEDRWTRIALEQPLGRWIVGLVGLAIVGAGLFNLYRALSQKFRKDLKEGQMGRQERRWYTALGILGHLARAVIFSLAGFFLIRAAWEYDAKEAIGLDGALRKLAHADYGPFLLGSVAAGLLAYALFCLVQARYREV